MSKPYDQKISQFLDNDLERSEALQLLKAMQQQPELQAKLRRYALAQHAIKSSYVIAADNNFAARVRQSLEAEPAYLLVPQQPKERYKLATALALAASVAIMAIVIPFTVKTAMIEKSGSMQLSQQEQELDQTTQQVRMYPVNRRFQDYLQAHNSSAYVSGASNLQPYVKLAGYELR